MRLQTRLCTIMALLLAVIPVPAGRAGTGSAWQPATEGWVSIRRIEDVDIYRREVEGSKFPALLALARIEASVRRVFDAISDYDHFREFIPSVVESRILNRRGPNTWVYQRLGFMRLVANRHYVIKVTDDLHEIDRGVIGVSWHLDKQGSDSLPLEHAVLPRTFSGSWRLASVPGASITDAAYSIHVDPGGKLPAWLFVWRSERYLYEVIQAVRRRTQPK